MRPCKLNYYNEFKSAAFLLLVIASIGFPSQASADEVSNSNGFSDDRFDNRWPMASDSELDQQRGGFLLPNGVNIDFSIEKVIYLNGVETFSSFFQLPENVSLLQNGVGDLAPDLANSALSSVIQNNLDNQFIRTVNEINLEISNIQNMGLNDGSRVFNDQIVPNIF